MKKIFLKTFIISTILTILFIFIANYYQDMIGGDAIEGHINNGKYYISIGNSQYVEVERVIWIKSYIITILLILTSLISGISMFIIVLLFLLKPIIQKIKEL